MISEAISPQPCNTGAPQPKNRLESSETPIRVSAHIDYLKLSGPPDSYPLARSIFKDIYPSVEPIEIGTKFYRKGLVHPVTQTHFLWHSSKQDEDWMLDIGGKGCQFIGDARQIVEAFKPLESQRHNCPRLDIAIDCFGDVSTFIDLMKESINAHAVQPILQFDPRNVSRGGGRKGHSFYYGSETSRKRLFMYDKGLQQGEGEGRWVRWETRFRDNFSSDAWSIIKETPCADVLQGLGAGIIKNVRGAGQEVFNTIARSPIHLSTPKRESTLQKRLTHIRRQCVLIAEAAQSHGVDPYELARRLDLFDLDPENPPSRDPRRTGFAQELIMDYYECDPYGDDVGVTTNGEAKT